MPTRQKTRGRPTMKLVVVDCAFAQDCKCSQKGYLKQGWMKKHLKKEHPDALCLAVSAGYCPPCNRSNFESKAQFIEHFMTAHVRALVSFSRSPAISSRLLSAAPSPSMREATNPHPSYPGQIPDNQGIGLPDSTIVTQQRPADIANKGRAWNDGTSRSWMGHPSTSTIPYSNAPMAFSYVPPADLPEYTCPTTQRPLPPAPAGRNTGNEFQGYARYPDQGGHISPQGPSWQGWQGWQ